MNERALAQFMIGKTTNERDAALQSGREEKSWEEMAPEIAIAEFQKAGKPIYQESEVAEQATGQQKENLSSPLVRLRSTKQTIFLSVKRKLGDLLNRLQCYPEKERAISTHHDPGHHPTEANL